MSSDNLPRMGARLFFPRDAMIRRVIGERIVGLTYGARGAFVGALHPPSMEGTSQSTAARGRPFQRLGHTAKAFNTLVFGTVEEAEAVIVMVARMHAKVSGTLEVDGGPAYPRGTSYAADDPEASFWTLAVLADSAEALYARFVRPLRPAEQERYWQDMRRFGEAFGMPPSTSPRSYGEYRERYDGMFTGGRLHLTPMGYTSGMRVALKGPLHPLLTGVSDVMYLLMVGTVREEVREAYGVEWTRQHELALRALTRAYKLARPLVPVPLRSGSAQPLIDVLVSEERRRLRGGLPVWAPA